MVNKKNIRYSLLGPTWKSTKRCIGLNLSTMIHVVRKRIKYILVNERPRDISRARLRDLMEELEITE